MQADATRNALSGALGTLRKVVSEEGVRSVHVALHARQSCPSASAITYTSVQPCIMVFK